MGDIADYLFECEQDEYAFHQSHPCPDSPWCSICTFEALSRIQVTVGTHIYALTWLWQRKGETFPIRSFLTGLGPYSPEYEAYVVRQSRLPLSLLKQRLDQFVGLDVEYYPLTHRVKVLDMRGRLLDEVSNPLIPLFLMEDRPENKMLW